MPCWRGGRRFWLGGWRRSSTRRPVRRWKARCGRVKFPGGEGKAGLSLRQNDRRVRDRRTTIHACREKAAEWPPLGFDGDEAHIIFTLSTWIVSPVTVPVTAT